MDVMPDISGDCFYPFQSRLHSPLQLQTSEPLVSEVQLARGGSSLKLGILEARPGEQETRRRGEELVFASEAAKGVAKSVS